MPLLTAFFKPTPRSPEQALIQWSANKILPRSTACVSVLVKARLGSYLQHPVYGEVKLISQVSPDILYVEYEIVDAETGETSIIRDEAQAVECSASSGTPTWLETQACTPHWL